MVGTVLTLEKERCETGNVLINDEEKRKEKRKKEKENGES